MATAPTCPCCGAVQDAGDRRRDALGVWTCAGCRVEFRPPGRVPIRDASTPAPPSTPIGWGKLLAFVVIGVILGIASAVIERPRPYQPPFEPTRVEPIDLQAPIQFEAPILPPFEPLPFEPPPPLEIDIPPLEIDIPPLEIPRYEVRPIDPTPSAEPPSAPPPAAAEVPLTADGDRRRSARSSAPEAGSPR